MNTPHTPAPWHVSRHATPDYVPQFGIYAGDGNGRDIAIVTSNEANANLIAAAPSLLAALEILLADHKAMRRERFARVGKHDIQPLPIQIYAEDAIAYAKGTP